MPEVAILTFVSAPFLEDIRQAVPRRRWRDVGRLVFDFLLTGGLIALAVVLILKSDRAKRACEDLRQQQQKDLADCGSCAIGAGRSSIGS